MDEFELSDHHLAAAGIEVEADTSNVDNQQVQEPNTQAQGGDSQTQAAASTPNKVESATGKDSLGNPADGGKKQGQADKGQGAADPKLNPGDIQLPDGSIVRAGAERRHFENARMFRQENIVLKNDLNTANQRFNSLQERFNTLTETVKSIGLENPTDVSNAVRLYKDLRTNPGQTITNLLAELKAAGHNVEGIGGAVDTAAIQMMLEDRMRPVNQGPTPEQQMRAIQEEADRDAAAFFSQFPDAKMHEGMIAGIIAAEASQGREASPRDVYFRLKSSIINQGLDWNSPLGPQIEARKNAATQQPQQKPIIQGRRGVGQVETTENIDPFKSGNNNSKDNIILAAMKDAGYNYQR